MVDDLHFSDTAAEFSGVCLQDMEFSGARLGLAASLIVDDLMLDTPHPRHEDALKYSHCARVRMLRRFPSII